MFGEHHRTGFENQDTVIPKLVTVEEMLRQGSAERPTANNDNVERLGIRTPGGALHGLIETVAHITTDDVLTKIRVLRRGTRHGHVPPFPMSAGETDGAYARSDLLFGSVLRFIPDFSGLCNPESNLSMRSSSVKSLTTPVEYWFEF